MVWNPKPADASPSEKIYQLRVTLMGTDPPIWRRVEILASASLKDLHRLIQRAMGWDDQHLHEFIIGKLRYGTASPGGGMFAMERPISESSRCISDVLARARSKARYVYDFGDDWFHEILVEKIAPADPAVVYPRCVGGELNCPPEDCGGIGGFYNLLEAISDPAHPDHEQLTEWLGDDYDPNHFSLEETNRRIQPRTRRKPKG